MGLLSKRLQATVLCCIAMAAASTAHAATVTYNFTGSSSGGAGSTGGLTGATAGNFSMANSFGNVSTPINNQSVSGGYSGASAGNNIGTSVNDAAFSTSSSPYFSVAFSPDSGNAITVTDFDFAVRSTPTGAKSYALYSSVDGYSSAIFSGFTTSSAGQSPTNTWVLKNNDAFTLTGAVDTAVTLRLYVWGGTDSASSGTINTKVDDIKIEVSSAPPVITTAAVPLPTAASAGLVGLGSLMIRRRR